MNRLASNGAVALAAIFLIACQPSELILRAGVVSDDIVITFYKRGVFGGEYRVRPCINLAILVVGGERIWQVSAPPEPPDWRPCRELDVLRVGQAPEGFDIVIPLDGPPSRERGDLIVSSQQGLGSTIIDLSALR